MLRDGAVSLIVGFGGLPRGRHIRYAHRVTVDSWSMAGDPPRADPRVVAAYLEDVDLYLDAAQRLVADPHNRLAAFHLQQAAEKLIKLVRLHRSLRLTAEHNLELLVSELPADDPWRAKLAALEPLSGYATSFRYPSSSGRRKTGPSSDEVLVWIKTIAALTSEARALVTSVP